MSTEFWIARISYWISCIVMFGFTSFILADSWFTKDRLGFIFGLILAFMCYKHVTDEHGKFLI